MYLYYGRYLGVNAIPIHYVFDTGVVVMNDTVLLIVKGIHLVIIGVLLIALWATLSGK